MKVQFSQSVDFNQMLVFSVFGHLLLLAFVLFLPKPRLLEKVVAPAFMVNLVSEPTGFKSAAPQRSESEARAKKPIAKQSEKKFSALKKTTASKLSEVKKVPRSKAILEKLNELEAKMALATPPGKRMVEELDQLARLEKPRRKPTKPIKEKPLTEETFQELETLKNKKVSEIMAVAPAPLHKDILEDFEELKMKESSLRPALEKEEPEKLQDSEVDLLKELQQLAKLDVSSVPEVKTQKPSPQESTQKSSGSFDSIMEKFGSLSVESEPVRVEVSSARLDSSSFQSKLRTLPKTSQAKTESGAGESYVFAKKEGVPGADIQSLYVGMIQELAGTFGRRT
jgi:hypothetical protein